MNPSLQRVDLVLPVHNEERALRPNLELLLDYLRTDFPFAVRVVIADNASTDATAAIAEELADRHPEAEALLLGRKGPGLALKTAWLPSDAHALSHMDGDPPPN